MNNTLKYKDFMAKISVDVDAGILVGEVVENGDRIVFDGRTVDEVKQHFHEAIDDYLALNSDLDNPTSQSPNFQQKLIELREKFNQRSARKSLVIPVTAPKYDEVYTEGVRWLNSLEN